MWGCGWLQRNDLQFSREFYLLIPQTSPTGTKSDIPKKLRVNSLKPSSTPIFEVFFTIGECKQEDKKVIQGGELIVKKEFFPIFLYYQYSSSKIGKLLFTISFPP